MNNSMIIESIEGIYGFNLESLELTREEDGAGHYLQVNDVHFRFQSKKGVDKTYAEILENLIKGIYVIKVGCWQVWTDNYARP